MEGGVAGYFAEFESGLAGAMEVLRYQVPIVVSLVSNAIDRGCCIAVAGNGGASAIASHFAGELIGEIAQVGGAAAPIVDLTGHSASLTALANDHRFESAVSIAASAMLKPGDVLLLFSTSGQSRNLIEAAKGMGAAEVDTVAVVGSGDSSLAKACKFNVVLTSSVTEVSQDYMSIFIHAAAIGVRSGLRRPS